MNGTKYVQRCEHLRSDRVEIMKKKSKLHKSGTWGAKRVKEALFSRGQIGNRGNGETFPAECPPGYKLGGVIPPRQRRREETISSVHAGRKLRE